jgi:hypothetical protein
MTEIEVKSKRLEILKDVIKQLDANKMIATKGVFTNRDFFHSMNQGRNSKDVFQETQVCTVCALGSLFLSSINLYNEHYIHAQDSTWNAIENRLQDYFETEQLALMEIAFEGGTGAFEWSDDEEEKIEQMEHEGLSDEEAKARDRALEFFQDNYVGSDFRLRLIINNAISNDGIFIP